MIDLVPYLLFLLVIAWFVAWLLHTRRKLLIQQTAAARERKPDPSDINAFDLTYEEFHRTLNFLLMYGVIDITDYQRMIERTGPYLR